jgi:hypothetical protein
MAGGLERLPKSGNRFWMKRRSKFLISSLFHPAQMTPPEREGLSRLAAGKKKTGAMPTSDPKKLSYRGYLTKTIEQTLSIVANKIAQMPNKLHEIICFD